MSMIADSCDGVHSYSSFFYPKLISSAGYSGVRRWTKKVKSFLWLDPALMMVAG